jgi:hypothetical protein
VATFYSTLISAADADGNNQSYLATEDNYRVVRDLQRRNLVVPLVGDFAGPKTIRSIGTYLRKHNAVIRVFYLSNVETYLFSATAGMRASAPNSLRMSRRFLSMRRALSFAFRVRPMKGTGTDSEKPGRRKERDDQGLSGSLSLVCKKIATDACG